MSGANTDDAEEKLRELERALESRTDEIEEAVGLRPRARASIAAAEELGADPIVLGSERKSRMEHALIGSVSAEVLRYANRTVLVVGGYHEDGGPESESPESESARVR